MVGHRKHGGNGHIKWGVAAVGSSAALSAWLYTRYSAPDVIDVAVREFSNAEYPLDPARRSIRFGAYTGRALTLRKRDDSHFDFVFASPEAHVATIVFRNVDVGVMTPRQPAWTRGDARLERIALIEREWNRQQVTFDPRTEQIEVIGGDGFESRELHSADLSNNCVSAGLWEVLLYCREHGDRALYYQGWFRFPLGHYRRVVEYNTGRSYFKDWLRLEHWINPAGTFIDLEKLRRVIRESHIEADDRPDELLLHVLPLSYERHTLIGHHLVRTPRALIEHVVEGTSGPVAPGTVHPDLDLSTTREVSS